MTRFLHGLVIDLRNKVQLLIEQLDRAAVHPDLASDYALNIQGNLERLQGVLMGMQADRDLLIPSLLINNFKKYRLLSREVQLLEAFPLPVILRYTEADHYFFKLCRWICAQIGYPLTPPVVSAISTDYYWAYPKYHLIAVPVGEEFLLLNLADFYHELAHFLYVQYTPYLVGGFTNDLDISMQREKQRADDEHQRKPSVELFEEVKFQWRENWIVEFVSDMVATYLVGPAYGWANLRLSVNSLARFDIFGPAMDEFSAVEHPSDEARMRGIYAMLRQLQLDVEIKGIDEKWQQFISLSGSNRPADYVYFYPDDLLATLAQYVFKGCKNIGVISFSEQQTSAKMNLAAILNTAWKKFLVEPEHYPDWERAQLQEVRAKLETI
jgi:hypothetical protein